MKKLTTFLAALLLVCGLLSGCGSSKILSLTDEEFDRISNYAALLLLKYDMNYKNPLLEEAKKTEEEKEEERLEDDPEKTPEEKEEANSDEVTPSAITAESEPELPQPDPERGLNEIFGLHNVDISYTGCSFAKSFPENAQKGYSVQAGEGRKLLLLKMQLKNNGAEPVAVNILDGFPSFRINFNGEEVVAKMTIILEDFSTTSETIPAGASIEKVLVGEVPESFNEQIETLSLTTRFNGDTSITTLVP